MFISGIKEGFPVGWFSTIKSLIAFLYIDRVITIQRKQTMKRETFSDICGSKTLFFKTLGKYI